MQGEPSRAAVLFLMGPTACGKTDLAAALSERFPLELVSVDAAQVYRGMDIGTAKPSQTFLERHPHHLIDIRDPADTYSAADFVSDASALVAEIHGRGRIPLLVGGTMFYFRALEKGLASLPGADPEIRAELERDLRERGVGALHDRLREVDPVTAERIERHDTQRIQRALEIHRATGRPPSEMMEPASGLGSDIIKLALFQPDRKALHERIALRFRAMLEQGLLDEVAGLAASLPDPQQCPAMRTVGYRQALELLAGRCDANTMAERAIAATRQLAKRQLTWMRQQSGLTWFRTDDDQSLEAVVRYLSAHPASSGNGH